MHCKQAEELLPLYAGRDLDEKRATLVAEHLRMCAACARVADEYRESVQLTEKFAPPVFSDDVYAGIRQRVLREIEAGAMAPAWSQTIASTFRPRLTWAIASVLLILVSMFALYFVTTKGNDEEQLVDKSPANIEPGRKEHSNSGTESDNGKKRQLAGDPRPQQKRFRGTLADKPVAVKSRDVMSTTNNKPVVLPQNDSAALDKRLRVEIQTQDPRIRIIWFVQQETKPIIPSSKGT